MHNPITRELIHSLHTAIDTIATKYSIADTININLTPTLRELEIVAEKLFKKALVRREHLYWVDYDLNGKRHRVQMSATNIDHLLSQMPVDAAMRRITPA